MKLITGNEVKPSYKETRNRVDSGGDYDRNLRDAFKKLEEPELLLL